MNEDDIQEIEMQTYSMSYSYPTTYPNQLPYQWDGDCHLTLNQTFYSSITDPPLSLSSDQFSFEEEYNDFMEELPMDFEELKRSGSIVSEESVVSINTLSTDGTNGNQKAETIDEQLEFILDSIKKQKKPEPKKSGKEKKKKFTRKRKTTEQIELLQQEITANEVMDRSKIRALATKVGLKVNQVYKWYWDFKKKQSEQLQHDS